VLGCSFLTGEGDPIPLSWALWDRYRRLLACVAEEHYDEQIDLADFHAPFGGALILLAGKQSSRGAEEQGE
jgi:hypothetical protein